MTGALRRIWGLVYRHLALYRRSWPRLVELAYWPVLQMCIWGFVTEFMIRQSGWAAAASGVLIGAVLLWEVCLRSQMGFAISFLEEVWSRNPRRVWLHTCTLDHPAALGFYVKHGFRPYRRAIEVADDAFVERSGRSLALACGRRLLPQDRRAPGIRVSLPNARQQPPNTRPLTVLGKPRAGGLKPLRCDSACDFLPQRLRVVFHL